MSSQGRTVGHPIHLDGMVNFMNVDGPGTVSVSPMRQNRRQVNESLTSPQKVSKPSR